MKRTKTDFITFATSNKLQISLIDKQHQEMCQLINKIYSAHENNIYSVVGKQLNKFIKLLEIHFAYEESLMLQTKFKGYFSHKLEHDRVYIKFEAIVSLYTKDKSVLTIDTLDGLKNWFYNHIEISDKKCGDHFVQMGIK